MRGGSTAQNYGYGHHEWDGRINVPEWMKDETLPAGSQGRCAGRGMH